MIPFMDHTRLLHPRLGVLTEAALDGEPSGALQEHLATCVSCRSTMAEVRRLSDAMRQFPAFEAPPHMLAMIRQRIANGDRVILPVSDISANRPAWRRGLPVALSAAAGVLIVISLWAGQSASPASASELPLRVRAMNGVLAGVASLRQAVVPRSERAEPAQPAHPGSAPDPAMPQVSAIDAAARNDSSGATFAEAAPMDTISCGTVIRYGIAASEARALIAAHAPDRAHAADAQLLVFVLDASGSLRTRAEGPPIPDDSIRVKGRYGIVDGHVTAKRTGTNLMWVRELPAAARGYCLSSMEAGYFRWPVALNVTGAQLPMQARGIARYEFVSFEPGEVAPAATQVVMIRL